MSTEGFNSNGPCGFLQRMWERATHLRQQAQAIEERRMSILRQELGVDGAPLDLQLDSTDPGLKKSLFVANDDGALVARYVAHTREHVEDDAWSSATEEQPTVAEESPSVMKSQDELGKSTGADGITPKLKRMLEHKYFTVAVSVIVMLNTVFIFIDEEHQASRNLGESWGSSWPYIFLAIDICFDIVFFVEVTIRLFVDRLAFFFQPFSLLDLWLVLAAISGKVISLASGDLTSDATRSRWFRVFRLGRLFWFVHQFESLWIIIIGVFSAFRTILWAFILLFIIIYVFGVLSVRIIDVDAMVAKENMDPDDAAELHIWFGGIIESMFTLLTMMTMEGWAEIVRVVGRYRPVAPYIFFYVFLNLTTWGLMNMVVAVIIDATVGKALHHLENYVKVTAAERTEAIKKICDCFFLAEVDSSKLLGREEFLRALENKEFVNKLHDVGIDVRQAHTLFDMLDFDNSGRLNVNEFCGGVLEARGKGHAMDVLRLKYDLKRYYEKSGGAVESLRGDLKAKMSNVVSQTRALTAIVSDVVASCQAHARD